MSEPPEDDAQIESNTCKLSADIEFIRLHQKMQNCSDRQCHTNAVFALNNLELNFHEHYIIDIHTWFYYHFDDRKITI